ncbi:unnamed protein product [Adineta ricciae]|uniref:F-box domain-containing protein n=1 Tax=Adineta ricciae TaxID=249248 RepID=A0A815KWY8_ADIRI|nr:unnamed protein product [Adineta ricciae]CAF1480576.1 unnamed protein product [Adineta ricciae]
MSTVTKRSTNENEISTGSNKRNRRSITCLLDLPVEIILSICRYLSPIDVLRSFYTPEQPHIHLHRIIHDYYQKINMHKLYNKEWIYLSEVLSNSSHPLLPHSLTLSNEYIPCITQYFFCRLPPDIVCSIFWNLKHLTMLHCSPNDLLILSGKGHLLPALQHLHISVSGRKLRHDDDDEYDDDDDTNESNQQNRYDLDLLYFIFSDQNSLLQNVVFDFPDGLILNQLLSPNRSIASIDLVLETIDDLYVLLNGLAPHVETMAIKLRRSRILSSFLPKSHPPCRQLKRFTLLETGIDFSMTHLESILTFMPFVLKLTLSIRNTNDITFCNGPTFESILHDYLPDLGQFIYTMTHQMREETSVGSFDRWPMNVSYYEEDHECWLHMYSLPWPVNKDDRRTLPIVKDPLNRIVQSGIGPDECVNDFMITNDHQWTELETRFRHVRRVRPYLPINILLPSKITNVTVPKEIKFSSVDAIGQPFVRSLVVGRRVTNDTEIFNLAQQFPNVEFLRLHFPSDKSLCVTCFQMLFSVHENLHGNRSFWKNLKRVSVVLTSQIKYLIPNATVTTVATIKTPGLDEYYDSYNKYAETLNCPCSKISILNEKLMNVNDWGIYIFQALASVCELLKSSTIADFLSSLYIVKDTSQINGLLSVLRTNGIFKFPPDGQIVNIEFASYNGCRCINSSECVESVSIYDDIAANRIFVAPGMFRNCQIIAALLQSNLACFYDELCFDELVSHINSSLSLNMTRMNASAVSRFSTNSTTRELLNELLVEEWNILSKFANYFNECRPVECT